MADIDGDDEESSDWAPRLDAELPPYLALLQALEGDIRSGDLTPGTRLPPHRTLATRLSLSISTVSKAYREAGARGLISGRTGQGTFVQAQDLRMFGARADGAPVNLGYNLAPYGRQREAIRAVLADLAQAPELDELFLLRSHQGYPEHRTVLARRLRAAGLPVSPGQIVATNGAQHGIDLAVQMFCAPGEAVMVEELTYVGFKALAASRQFPLIPVGMDGDGLLPEALEAVILRDRARVLYVTPTLQVPTARTMPPGRRAAIAEVVRRHDIRLIEGDVYGFMPREPLLPIAALIPERTIYLASFSKILDLGYRLGLMVVPPPLVDRANLAMRATAWTTAPMLVEIVVRLIESGRMDELIADIRRESRARYEVFRRVFAEALADQPEPEHTGYHVWLPLPPGWNPHDLFYAARNEGIVITPPGSAGVDPVQETGVRLCLGPSATRRDLERALTDLKRILDGAAPSIFNLT